MIQVSETVLSQKFLILLLAYIGWEHNNIMNDGDDDDDGMTLYMNPIHPHTRGESKNT
jgi:hypothetical protein